MIGKMETSRYLEISFINVNFLYKRKTCGLVLEFSPLSDLQLKHNPYAKETCCFGWHILVPFKSLCLFSLYLHTRKHDHYNIYLLAQCFTSKLNFQERRWYSQVVWALWYCSNHGNREDTCKHLTIKIVYNSFVLCGLSASWRGVVMSFQPPLCDT